MLSEYCRVSKTAVRKWIVKLREKLTIALERKPRKLIAIDETSVEVNGQQYWVYAALDIPRNELIAMRVYPTRNMHTSESFLIGVLKLCEGKPEFMVDKAPWLKEALIEMDLTHQQGSFGPRSLVESSFSSFKQRTKIFFNKITVNEMFVATTIIVLIYLSMLTSFL